MKICITGIDGSGKTTLINSLSKKLADEGENVGVVGVRQIFAKVRDHISPAEIQKYILKLSPEARFLFICHAFLDALDEMERAEDSSVTIIDGYWMKYLATDVSIPLSWISNCKKVLPLPDKIVFLELNSFDTEKKIQQTPYEHHLRLSGEAMEQQERLHSILTETHVPMVTIEALGELPHITEITRKFILKTHFNTDTVDKRENMHHTQSEC